MKPADLSGRRFGRLVARRLLPERRGGQAIWLCDCDCGSTHQAASGKLTSGWTKSCGCLKAAVTSANKRKNIAGRVFGKLVAVEPSGRVHGGIMWLCRCECGGTTEVRAAHLLKGAIRSCGCLREVKLEPRYGRLEVLDKPRRDGNRTVVSCRCDCGTERVCNVQNLLRGATTSCGCFSRELRTTHGHTKDRNISAEYRIWCGMNTRCRKKSDPRYGGRGISVCERWRDDFTAFLADMGPRPSPDHSLDRIDMNGNYEPSNCRWATDKEQNLNRRSPRLISVNGIAKPLAEWLELVGVGLDFARLIKGRRIEEVLTEIVPCRRRPASVEK